MASTSAQSRACLGSILDDALSRTMQQFIVTMKHHALYHLVSNSYD
jgi:hypothetical protein